MYHDSLKHVVQDVLIKIFVRGGCLALAGQRFGSHHLLTVYLGSRNCLCKRARCCCVDSSGVQRANICCSYRAGMVTMIYSTWFDIQ